MIAAAVAALKDRTGSSHQAILKYVCANYKVDAAKAGVHIRMALKRAVAAGDLKMAKATGKGAGSYKLGEKKVAKKPAAKKPKARSPLPRSPLLRSLLPRSPLPRRLPPRRSKL